RRITEKGLNNSSAQLLPANKTILFTSRATIGTIGILEEEASTNQGFQSLIVNDFSDVNFLYYKLLTMKKLFLKNSVGSTFLEIYGKTMKKIDINIPSKTEQEKIGKLLSSIDKAISLHKRKIELELKYVEALKESFIPYSEQIQKSFNNIEYRVVKLEDILKERKETNVPNDEYQLVSFTTDEGVTKKTKRYNREFLVRKSEKKYKKTLYNDLVYNPANLKFGAINRNTFGNAVFSPIYITFTTSQDSEYLEYVFTQWNFINKALKYQEGTVYERSSVKPKDFLKIKLAIPNDINDQKFIASLIDQKLIATNKSKAFLKKLEKLKDYYLKDLFI